MSRTQRNKEPQGHPVREMDGQPGRYESYFRTVYRPGFLKECAIVNGYLETNGDGYLLEDLDAVLSKKKKILDQAGNEIKRRRLEETERLAEEFRALAEESTRIERDERFPAPRRESIHF